MTLRSLHDRVPLRRLHEEGKTAGGIFIPETAKEKPMRAKVVVVGNGARLRNGLIHALDVSVDDIVLIGRYADSEIKIDSEEPVVARENEFLGGLELAGRKPQSSLEKS